MKIVKEFSGSYEVVSLNMKEATSKYPLLCESVGEVTFNVVGSTVRPKYTVFVWLGYTGVKAYACVALAKSFNNKKAEAILLVGEDWETRSIIQAANNLVGAVFIEAGLRDRRSLIIEICIMVHDQLQEMNSKQIDEISTDDVKITLCINEYEALLDVEYIEEVMGFWGDSELKN